MAAMGSDRCHTVTHNVPIQSQHPPSSPLSLTHTHTLERDTGGRSPGHADNDTPSEVATSHYTQSLHAGQPPALLALRSSCCAASQSYLRPGPGTVVFAERDRERLCRREQNVCRAMPVLAVCAEQPPAARAARHARQPGPLHTHFRFRFPHMPCTVQGFLFYGSSGRSPIRSRGRFPAWGLGSLNKIP